MFAVPVPFVRGSAAHFAERFNNPLALSARSPGTNEERSPVVVQYTLNHVVWLEKLTLRVNFSPELTTFG